MIIVVIHRSVAVTLKYRMMAKLQIEMEYFLVQNAGSALDWLVDFHRVNYTSVKCLSLIYQKATQYLVQRSVCLYFVPV